MKQLSSMLLVLLFLNVVAIASASAADEPLSTITPLTGALENQEMRIIEINLEPGQSSSPHRHNAHVFVYVLEGEVEMQVRGGPIVKLGPGETFYESPSDIHQTSRNASSTASAKFLVHMLKVAGAPTTVAVD